MWLAVTICKWSRSSTELLVKLLLALEEHKFDNTFFNWPLKLALEEDRLPLTSKGTSRSWLAVGSLFSPVHPCWVTLGNLGHGAGRRPRCHIPTPPGRGVSGVGVDAASPFVIFLEVLHRHSLQLKWSVHQRLSSLCGPYVSLLIQCGLFCLGSR